MRNYFLLKLAKVYASVPILIILAHECSKLLASHSNSFHLKQVLKFFASDWSIMIKIAWVKSVLKIEIWFPRKFLSQHFCLNFCLKVTLPCRKVLIKSHSAELRIANWSIFSAKNCLCESINRLEAFTKLWELKLAIFIDIVSTEIKL